MINRTKASRSQLPFQASLGPTWALKGSVVAFWRDEVAQQ